MTIKILYFAELKEIAQKDSEELEGSKISVIEIAKFIIKNHKTTKSILLNKSSDDLNPQISVAINDNFVKKNDIDKILVVDGDKIAFLLPLSGG
ncbi:MAG: MoaD/ThiS family protein [Candidatus Lokiarchaeota archaeon]|nr:MoaD/ThiS family protein [Candidatus Lokiarchaeota archaeon]